MSRSSLESCRRLLSVSSKAASSHQALYSTLSGLIATAAAAVLLQNRRCCWKKATTRPGSTSVGGCERAGTATAVSRPAAADYGSKCALLLLLLLWWCFAWEAPAAYYGEPSVARQRRSQADERQEQDSSSCCAYLFYLNQDDWKGKHSLVK